MRDENGDDALSDSTPADTSGRDRDTESTPTTSGHSTAADQAERNQEDESPS